MWNHLNHNLNSHETSDNWNTFLLWCDPNKITAFICVIPFSEWTENVLKKSHSVNMCIIIHSSGCIVCLLWPHFQRAWKQAGGVGSPNKGLSSPPAWASEMLTTQHTEPFTGLLAIHEWQLNHHKLFSSTAAGLLHCKIFLPNSNVLNGKSGRWKTIQMFLCDSFYLSITQFY